MATKVGDDIGVETKVRGGAGAGVEEAAIAFLQGHAKVSFR